MNSNRKSQNVFAQNPSLQILWKCAVQRRLVTRTLLQSISFKTIYQDVFHYVNGKNRRRSSLSLILDSHLMLAIVFVYSKTVLILSHDVERLYKDAVVHRFFEFETTPKSKLTRKKENVLTKNQWRIDLDENLLPDERILLERDFSIEIPREKAAPEALSPFSLEFSRKNVEKRITLLPEIEEPVAKFDLIDDRFGEPLPPQQTTMPMDVDQQQTDLPRFHDENQIERVETIDRTTKKTEFGRIRSAPSEILPIEIEPMEISTIDKSKTQFSLDAFYFFRSSLDVFPNCQSVQEKSGSSSTRTDEVLLSAQCGKNAQVPMIFVEEPTPLEIDEAKTPIDNRQFLHRSRKNRTAPDGITKRRKFVELFENIRDFDYAILDEIEAERNELIERWQKEGKHWPSLFGTDGEKRMNELIGQRDPTINTDILLDEITTLLNSLLSSGPNENFPFPQDETEMPDRTRKTSQEIAVHRGATSQVFPANEPPRSSIFPEVEQRASEIVGPNSMFDVLPIFSDENPRNFASIENRRPKEKENSFEQILDLAKEENGFSFNEFLKRIQSTRLQSSRLFSSVLVLLGEGKIRAQQNEAFHEIRLFRRENFDLSNKENQNFPQPMDFYDSSI